MNILQNALAEFKKTGTSYEVVSCRSKMRIALLLLLLSLPGSAQINIQGKTQISGGIEVNYPFTHNVQIMAYNPPVYSSSTTGDYYNFTNDVMTQPYVDGVTLELDWANIETAWPSTPCAPINTDVCQLDSAGVYHNYHWSAVYDLSASTANPLGVLQWFSPFLVNGVSTYKKVNFILAGINSSGNINSVYAQPINGATPWYVTSSGYAANFPVPYNRQDVMNTVLDCTNLPWTGVSSATYAYNNSTSAKVNSPQCCSVSATINSTSLRNGDTVWVTSVSGSPYATSGAAISLIDDDDFSYPASVLPGSNCADCVYITTSQSTPVPYEQPYLTAWEAFMAAANLHYNPNYSVSGVGVVGSGTGGTNQLGYVRSGTWVGGESFAECISGLTGLTAPYNFSNPATWLNDYQTKISYVQSLSPTMQRLWPIDDGTDPDSMAAIAVAAGNGFGYINGFGSQGLSLLDTCSPGGSAGDWCYEFTNTTNNYFARGMPLELQQIAISDPDVNPCTMTPPRCGTPPDVSGDLRGWLPFAVKYNATVIEMYYQDLGLAFDKNYCNSTGSQCYHLPTINTSPSALTWYCEVGYGAQYGVHTCTQGCEPGGCYSAAIIAAHGPQQ